MLRSKGSSGCADPEDRRKGCQARAVTFALVRSRLQTLADEQWGLGMEMAASPQHSRFQQENSTVAVPGRHIRICRPSQESGRPKP